MSTPVSSKKEVPVKKKKILFLLPLLVMCAFLYWSRPGTIEELYGSIDLEQMEWTGGHVRIYEGHGPEQSFVSTRWFPSDSPEFEQFITLVENTTFRRSWKNLLPQSGTRRSSPLQEGMYALGVSFRDIDLETGFDLQDFYGELTIMLQLGNMREEYITVVDNDSWSATCRELILALGQAQETGSVDNNL